MRREVVWLAPRIDPQALPLIAGEGVLAPDAGANPPVGQYAKTAAASALRPG